MSNVCKRMANSSPQTGNSPKKTKTDKEFTDLVKSPSASRYVRESKFDKDTNENCDDQRAISDNVGHKRLKFDFYDRNCEELAISLLGRKLVTLTKDGKRLSGKIVETEAYVGPSDLTAHSRKRTQRCEAMFMNPGTAYVYNMRGYSCFNISSKGEGAAVLIRALEPLENLNIMNERRNEGRLKKNAQTKKSAGNSFMKMNGKMLCNGPGKLCEALGIRTAAVNKLNLCRSENIWLEKGKKVKKKNVVKCKRINCSKEAGEWRDKQLRFYVLGSRFVSVKDKVAEEQMNYV